MKIVAIQFSKERKYKWSIRKAAKWLKMKNYKYLTVEKNSKYITFFLSNLEERSTIRARLVLEENYSDGITIIKAKEPKRKSYLASMVDKFEDKVEDVIEEVVDVVDDYVNIDTILNLLSKFKISDSSMSAIRIILETSVDSDDEIEVINGKDGKDDLDYDW